MAVAAKEIALKSERMEVVLDGQFPRVFEFRVAGGSKLLGAIASDLPTVELNETIYTPAEFTVTSQATPQGASCRIRLAKVTPNIHHDGGAGPSHRRGETKRQV